MNFEPKKIVIRMKDSDDTIEATRMIQPAGGTKRIHGSGGGELAEGQFGVKIPGFEAGGYKRLKMDHPELWKIVTPRDYTKIGNFADYRAASVGMILAAQYLREAHRTRTDDPCSRAIYAAASQAKRNDFPAFFVAPKLLHAMMLTDPPPRTEWSGLNLPFEAGYFVLPHGALLHPERKSPVPVIGWGRIQAGAEIKLTDGFYPSWMNPHEFFTVWTCIPGMDFMIFDSTMTAERSPFIGDWNPQPGGESAITGIYNAQGALTDTQSIPLSKNDSEFLHQMRILAFNLLLAADARPDLVTYGHRAKTQYKSKVTLWHPNVIGLHWQEKREVLEDPNREKGTHASPRPHWRRGHYSRQRFGKGRAQTKTIWREPVFVGLGKE